MAASHDTASGESPSLTVGDRFEERVIFDVDSIRLFARMSGDWNPLHHDEDFAAKSRFGALIACGPHVISRMMGLTATHFTRQHGALGLDFSFRFVRGVPAGATLNLVWTITGVASKPSLRGHLVSIEGRAIDDEGVVYVNGHGTILVRPALKGSQ